MSVNTLWMRELDVLRALGFFDKKFCISAKIQKSRTSRHFPTK